MTKEQGREILAKITGGLTETDICSVMLTPKQTLSIAEYVEAIEKERDDLRAALTNAAAFIENAIEDGSETEKYDRSFVAELVSALKGYA